jgi:hypothetical protein
MTLPFMLMPPIIGKKRAALASGAFFDIDWSNYDASVAAVPNSVSEVPLSTNVVRAPSGMFNNTLFWSKGGLTVVDGLSGGWSSLVAAGDFFLGAVTNNMSGAAETLPAGTHTVGATVISNSGGTEEVSFSKDNTATRSTAKSVGTSETDISYTFTLGAPASFATVLLCSKDGSTGANIKIKQFRITPGSVDPGFLEGDQVGHVYLGRSSYTTRTTVSGGVVNMHSPSANFGLMQFAEDQDLSAGTMVTIISKDALDNGYEGILSKLESYTDFTWLLQLSKAPYQYIGGGHTWNACQSLWYPKDAGFLPLWVRWDASGVQMGVDQFVVYSDTTSPGAVAARNFFFGTLVDAASFAAGFKQQRMVGWPTKLSDDDLSSSIDAMCATAETAGVTVVRDTTILLHDGDSISASGHAVVNKYAAQSSPW